jgi:hypothetical protein
MLLLRVIDYPNIAAPVDGGFLGYKQDLVLRDNPSFPKWEIAVTHEPTRKIPTVRTSPRYPRTQLPQLSDRPKRLKTWLRHNEDNRAQGRPANDNTNGEKDI